MNYAYSSELNELLGKRIGKWNMSAWKLTKSPHVGEDDKKQAYLQLDEAYSDFRQRYVSGCYSHFDPSLYTYMGCCYGCEVERTMEI